MTFFGAKIFADDLNDDRHGFGNYHHCSRPAFPRSLRRAKVRAWVFRLAIGWYDVVLASQTPVFAATADCWLKKGSLMLLKELLLCWRAPQWPQSKTHKKPRVGITWPWKIILLFKRPLVIESNYWDSERRIANHYNGRKGPVNALEQCIALFTLSLRYPHSFLGWCELFLNSRWLL